MYKKTKDCDSMDAISYEVQVSVCTGVVESKQQRAGDGKGQEPDDRDHQSHASSGAVARVVE